MKNEPLITFNNNEMHFAMKIGQFIDHLDHYQVPEPTEPDAHQIFNRFKEDFEFFKELFEQFDEAGSYYYTDKRRKEMNRIYDKLLSNCKLLQSHQYYCDNVEQWSNISGNNVEIDYFVSRFIDSQ